MDRNLVEGSKNIRSVGYDPEKEELEVEFVRKGDKPSPVYVYEGVSPELHKAWAEAGYRGGFFHTNIRSNKELKYRKVEAEKKPDVPPGASIVE